jgi:hypothetical protein
VRLCTLTFCQVTQDDSTAEERAKGEYSHAAFIAVCHSTEGDSDTEERAKGGNRLWRSTSLTRQTWHDWGHTPMFSHMNLLSSLC